MRNRAPVLALLAVVAATIPPSAPAYHFHGVKWPGGFVPYFNAAPDQSWAVNQAIYAWNHSGARIHFVPAPRSQAKLLINDPSDKVYCSEGRASVGYVPNAHVVIFPSHGITHACNRYWAAQIMAHELGHVLGLQHGDRYCATMNSSGSYRGGRECEPRLLWAWRCRLLEPDDIAGVAAIYGGKLRPVTTPAQCPLYGAIAAPTHAREVYDKTTGTVQLTFQRPEEPSIPSFAVPSPWHSHDSFAILGPLKTCPSNSTLTDAALIGVLPRVTRWRWHAKPGGRQTFTVPAIRGRSCYAIWSLDKLGRPSLTAAKLHVSTT